MPDPTAAPPVRTLELPGGAVAYREIGAGPLVVALHGLPGSARDFRFLGAALGGRTRLVALDLPGFGETPLGTLPTGSLLARADLVGAFLDALDAAPAVLLAHSMGGPLAMATAVRHPERVRALALLSSAGVRPHTLVRAFPVPPWALSLALSAPGGRTLLGRPLHAAMARAGFGRVSRAQAVHTVHCVAGTSFGLVERCASDLRVPTLLAWARDDRVVEPAIGEELYWRCPPGPRIAYPDGGHDLPRSRAPELADALVQWLGQLSAGDESSPSGGSECEFVSDPAASG